MGNYAYLANYNDGLRIYDVAVAPNPVSVGHGVPRPVVDVAVAGNYAYLAIRGGGLSVCDVTDPSNPVEVAYAFNMEDLSGAHGVAVSGAYAYLATVPMGVFVYSLGVPDSFRLGIGLTGSASVELSWPAPTAAFLVQHSSGLGASGWETLTNVPQCSGGRNRVSVPPPGSPRFYRLVSE